MSHEVVEGGVATVGASPWIWEGDTSLLRLSLRDYFCRGRGEGNKAAHFKADGDANVKLFLPQNGEQILRKAAKITRLN